LALLWILEFKEPQQAFRSMELTVKTRNADVTQGLLRQIMKQHGLEAEVRRLDPPENAEDIGLIQYYLNLRLNISTDLISDSILEADPDNVRGIEWKRTKNLTNVFQ